MVYLTVLFIILFYFFILYFAFSKFYFQGTDHYGHVIIVKAIKENRNRFILRIPQKIGQTNFAYPQFLHWMLSFFSIHFVDKKHHIINTVLNLSIMLVILYAGFYFYEWLEVTPIDKSVFLFLVGIFYTLNPINFCEWNAKNLGINSRSFGLLLGLLLNGFVFLFLKSPTVIHVLPIILVLFFILLSSQFATQYAYLSIFCYLILTQHYLFVVAMVVPLIAFFVVSPNFFKQYFKGQILHKKIFRKYLMPEYVLSGRKSIWLDPFTNFYPQLTQHKIHGVVYVFYNPIVFTVLSSLLFFIALCFSSVKFSSLFSLQTDLGILSVIVFTSYILFVLTSFKGTRFLGEPERYVEFTIPFSTILSLKLLSEIDNMEWLLAGVLFLFIAASILQVFFAYKNKVNLYVPRYRKNLALYQAIKEDAQGDEVRLLLNGWQLAKYFETTDFRLVSHEWTNTHTGKFHYKELFTNSFVHIDEDILFDMVDAFDINYLILDANFVSRKKMEEIASMKHLKRIFSDGNRYVFKIVT